MCHILLTSMLIDMHHCSLMQPVVPVPVLAMPQHRPSYLALPTCQYLCLSEIHSNLFSFATSAISFAYLPLRMSFLLFQPRTLVIP
ncbi:hypothetical protein K503DRAFT_563405 [Rhizopogon vinicolor AM-OR11-026]|uniref:Uncharacterized protein n=1 Tax=Rhizopogon vinicolor AM-OR11-026 TaxID=1314800 RepID=A0A1B7MK74_9AGAM|nr:hypothetical protein K503DRAFT_563405 [Rhizopogon vinicolor AM-OR11-026]